MAIVNERAAHSATEGDRLSRFSEACLRISESLDFGTVLQEVIDGACSLTDARYGALLTFDSSGAMDNFVTTGMTPVEQMRLGDLPKGLGILGYLSDIEGPLRLADIAAHPRSVGFPSDHPPMKTFLGSPIRYQGERLGNIYLTEKAAGQEFSQEDEDILVLFASQAALVVANARRVREERQARADLEAILNISPVGVLVFDANTGGLVSNNEEARRIVGHLNVPGRDHSQLLEMMTLRTTGGREIPIDEFPTTKAQMSGETVRSEEVVIHLRDGRSITTLINARPIQGEDGEVVSVVATIQDITALDDLKRQRAEFMGRVSHELRTPLTAIKGSVATVLGASHVMDAAEVRQFLRVIDEQADHIRLLLNDLVDITQIETGTLSVNLEATDLGDLVKQARDAVVTTETEGQIVLDLAPDLPWVMADRGRIFQVLTNVLKVASEHFSIPSTIWVSASAEELHTLVSVETAIGVETLELVSDSPNDFQWADSEHAWNEDGSDGQRLAICRGIVEAHGGRMSAKIGSRGVRFDFTIPAADEIAGAVEKGHTPRGGRMQEQGRGQARILAIDSDPEARRNYRSTLAEADFAPVVSGDPDEIELLISMERPHLLIVEPALSWGEEYGLMERIRKTSDAPVIFVASHGNGQQMERAFEFGVADYVVKPFTPTELVARVRAALRRHRAPSQESPEPFVLGDLTIDYAERLVTVDGRRVHLTATEYKLLSELSVAAGHVLTYEQLLRRAWGPLYSTDPRIVRTYIKQLRSKLGDNARHPTYIFTEPRVGYHMANPRQHRNPTEN